MWEVRRGGAHKLTRERIKRLVSVFVPACHFACGHAAPLFINEQSSGDASPVLVFLGLIIGALRVLRVLKLSCLGSSPAGSWNAKFQG